MRTYKKIFIYVYYKLFKKFLNNFKQITAATVTMLVILPIIGLFKIGGNNWYNQMQIEHASYNQPVVLYHN